MGAALLLVWATTAVAQSKTIYLNRYGQDIRPGGNDARAHTSSIVSEPVSIQPWDVTEETWAATVACMRETWARFDVTFTEEDPGNKPHLEALFGGRATDIGKPPTNAGLGPFASDCSIVENAIVFTFTESLPNDPDLVCGIMSQELGHAYGLDHELLAGDPMSYLRFDGRRNFQDTAAECGEKTARPCGLDGHTCRATQSSVQLLLERVGPSAAYAEANPDAALDANPDDPGAAGCAAGGVPGIGAALGLLALGRRRRRH